MGKKTGFVALLLGVFLLGIAVLAKFYAYDELAVVPLDQDTETVSKTAPGDDATYLNVGATGGPAVETGPLESRRTVVGKVELSEEASEDLDEDVAVWDTFSYTAPPGTAAEDALSATRDLVPFDRHTAETVRWSGAMTESGGQTIQPFSFSGNYFKFPFNTQKESVEFWDGSVRKAVPAEYEATEEIEGLTVYRFVQTIEPVQIATQEVPGSLVGEDVASLNAERIYSNTRTLWVEPETGVIIKGQEEQFATLEVDGSPRLTITDATLGYDEETVSATVDEYESKAMLLGLVRTEIPVVATVLGVLLVLLGGFLLLRANRSGSTPSDDDTPAEPGPADGETAAGGRRKATA
ncbi:Protein of unknown function (DUF3068) [Mumia flava]|uniref:DUF3068 family protein n=1 Tax=Mumia flava TaxID=1348852 RepID=A0A0B2BDR2_9ACTN|nr:DUF3068 domain-containing protein [Mumia flava]PJJ55962.1 Protein of unknown function (DUF3068) [Mumia flava]